ncbi:MAG: glycosyl hydrolase family 32, partial [Microbacterium sp. 13-71-7]
MRSMHFRPAQNWMNDPNGLVFHDGRYHLYFQYNPEGATHGFMSWGHASSTDLVRWEEHPVAIRYTDAHEIFSGSVVVDEHDTSGLGAAGEPPLIAVFTLADQPGRHQAQGIASSLDGGLTWRLYDGNPVLDRGSADFRDPKVFRYAGPAGEYWVMVAVEAEERRVVLYRSADLKAWTYLSDYGPRGATGGVWECPDLFPLSVDGDPSEVRWVLLISLNPGGIAGGSGTQYVIGSFDGVRFLPDEPMPPAARGAGWENSRAQL